MPHSVIEVGIGGKGRYLRTVGGNESDTVEMKEIRLKPNGLINNNSGYFIAIIESLK